MYELHCTTCDLIGAPASDPHEALSLADIHNTMLHGGAAVATVHDAPSEVRCRLDAA
jgi:hypothetical protein